ncbi:MAG: magnesium and cobalt transport protein CorA [Propionibacteriaceae bacterium]|jgi:magnesium transporter|nr:magnesium and cobalt transport protein CorA [Propionibacteriaceae bacterium]
MVPRKLPADAWLNLVEPATERVDQLADDLNLHDLLREDLVQAHQNPKLERYGDTLFAVLHTAHYVDSTEQVQFAEVHVLVRPDQAVTITHGFTRAVATARRRMSGESELLSLGPEAVLYAVLDAVVDEYGPVVKGFGHDVSEIDYQVFSADPGVSHRIWSLSGQVAQFDRAAQAMREVLGGLMAGFGAYSVPEQLQSYLRDVADHLRSVIDATKHYRDRLRDILTLNATLVSQRQIEEIKKLNEAGQAENDAMKRISAWAAIVFVPSVIAGIYGMNFDNMPELHWAYGYPFSLGLMLVATVGLWVMFKVKHWI